MKSKLRWGIKVKFDFWLIREIKNGDRNACDEFVKRYYERVLAYCFKRLSDEELAKDLTQETFLRFFEHIFEYSPQNKTINYLYTIAGNLIKNEYKKKKELFLEELFEIQEQTCDLKDCYQETSEKMDIKKMLSKLPEEYRECLELFYLYEYKQAEISEILNISLSLVKYRLRKGKEALKDIVRESSDYE